MRDIRSNIGKIYAYKFLSEFYLIAPILIPYYLAHRLTSTQIFVVQAVYALAVVLLEIPSGYLADVIGRRKTLILGAAAFPAGIAVYAVSQTFGLFILAEVILAVANSMRSGCDTALVYDTLLEMGQAQEYTRFEGRAVVFTRIGTSASSVLGGAGGARNPSGSRIRKAGRHALPGAVVYADGRLFRSVRRCGVLVAQAALSQAADRRIGSG